MDKMRKKYQFNFIDVLLILIIVLSIAVIAFLTFYDGDIKSVKNDNAKVEVMYTIESRNIDNILRGKINRGDTVIDSESLKEIGQVVDVEYTDSVYTGFNSEKNEQFEALYAGHIDIKVKISATAELDENGVYSVNGYILNTGKEMEVIFPYYVGKGLCISFSEVNE